MLSAVIRWEFSYPAMPASAEQPAHQGFPHPSPLVLGTNLLKSQTGIQDRDRTVLRRSEPSSRTTLTGEQPDPWGLLQSQDVMSRHRGAKPHRRCGRLDAISLFVKMYNYIFTISNFLLH